ncbi:MAG: sigma-54-dependent Fis family transcriptional regulator [Gammaproteobacteria bacterium]|nr:MAG: sigma-54-dependent Fis family transcriptional regulator [Gammaproteobacteria bacterium]
MASILIVDDEPGIRSFLQKGLKDAFGLVEVADSIEKADALKQRCHFDLIIVDIRMPGKSGVEWIKELREQGSMASVIFMTAYADLETAIEALRAGAADFLMKPFRLEQMMAAIGRCMERQKMLRENFVLRRQVDKYIDNTGMVGNCELFKKVCETVKRVAPMPSTVLIEGESGTGKELVARAIHDGSKRSGSFVPVNCGAISAELLESELFGHVKGAFTGAHQSREGLFTYANGGTLFLDEIGEMPMSMQTHLLRVLEERTIRPVGGNREVPVDVRVLAATNRDLFEQVQQGTFRRDLYYRLNVVTIYMPTLRERKEDILVLARHFSVMLAAEMGIQATEINETELVSLASYDWPGNVRELKNVIERSLLLNVNPSQCIVCKAGLTDVNSDLSEENDDDDVSLEAIEKRHILAVLEQEGGNKSAAARLLGVSRKTLERKTQAWGIR